VNAARPIDVVRSRFDIVFGAPPKMRARCPSHGSKGGTIAIRETQDGKVLIHCFAGCKLSDILSAANLTEQDLFPDGESQRQRDREMFEARRRFKASPKRTIHEELTRELQAWRSRSRAELGYVPPAHASDLNAVRGRVRLTFGLEKSALPDVEPFVWECYPHSLDPAWPCLFMRALDDVVRKSYHALYPQADAWETDAFVGLYDRIVAERLARDWLRAMAS
jgi:hypothetical protein